MSVYCVCVWDLFLKFIMNILCATEYRGPIHNNSGFLYNRGVSYSESKNSALVRRPIFKKKG